MTSPMKRIVAVCEERKRDIQESAVDPDLLKVMAKAKGNSITHVLEQLINVLVKTESPSLKKIRVILKKALKEAKAVSK